jgi:UDP-2,3-diacylglucosamine hydrolase
MKNKRILLVIADCHLGVSKNDVELLLRFLQTLNPLTQEILFLGDLFQVWAAPKKYHTAEVTLLLNGIRDFVQKGGRVHLNVGNRDIFFPELTETETAKELPFTTITNGFFQLDFGQKRLLAIHGDTINSRDFRYLVWRKFIRTKVFRGFLNLLPAKLVKKIMFDLERSLKDTNVNFRLEFPGKEWEIFLTRLAEEKKPDLFLAGHFHPSELITTTIKTTTGIVVPDWYQGCHYLSIDHNLNYQLAQFKP